MRVRTYERAEEIAQMRDGQDWEVIIGVAPDNTEDITDVLKLLEPDRSTVRVEPRVGRSDPCPCGSPQKYKKYLSASTFNVRRTAKHESEPTLQKCWMNSSDSTLRW